MIIGVDAGAISIRDDRLKVGVYRVTLELFRQLSLLDPANEYRLYSFQPIDENIMKTLGSNMRNAVLSPATGYFSLRLPLELLIHPVDVFLGLSQSLPVMRKGRAIGMVHDIGFIHKPHLYGADASVLKKQTDNLMIRAGHIIAVSQTVKKDIVNEYGISEKNITVCHEGVSSSFSFKAKPMEHKNPYFLFVGSLRKGKNIDALVKIFHRFLAHSERSYDLVLVGGDFWPDKKIEETIKNLHLEKHVRSVGVVSDEMLARYYRGAMAFVTTSQSEGFCLPAVEAMACGCPVIAHDTGALAEVVGDAGMLVPPNLEEHFVRCMTDMVSGKKKRKSFSEAGIRKAKQYNWTTFAQNVLHIIHADTE